MDKLKLASVMGVKCMNGSVKIINKGRLGTIIYSDPRGVIELEREFGGTVVAFIYLPSPDEWSKLYPWSIKHKDEILKFICDEVIRQKARGCVAEMQPDQKAIYIKSIDPDKK